MTERAIAAPDSYVLTDDALAAAPARSVYFVHTPGLRLRASSILSCQRRLDVLVAGARTAAQVRQHLLGSRRLAVADPHCPDEVRDAVAAANKERGLCPQETTRST